MAEDEEKESPTKHQGIKGLTCEQVADHLMESGFELIQQTSCDCAFITPKPTSSGGGGGGGNGNKMELCAVPYLYCRARKI